MRNGRFGAEKYRSERKEPEGLGGLLLLPVLGLLFSPLTMLHRLSSVYIPIFRDGYWHLFIPVRPAFFQPSFSAYFVFDVLGSLALAALTVYVLDLLFRRDRRLPKRVILLYLCHLTFSLIDLALVSWLLGVDLERGGRGTVVNLQLSVLQSVFWIPYFTLSRRVRNTFV